MKNKILYSGNFLNKSELGKFRGPAVSANRMQLGLLQELDKVLGDFDLISVLPIAAYPTEKMIVEKKIAKLVDSGDKEYYQLPFLNLPYIKQLSIRRNLYKELKKSKADLIINFNPYYELQKATLGYCHKYNKKSICIVADIPVTIPKQYSFLKKCFRRYEIKEYYKAISKYDGVIVLNKLVLEEFGLNCPYYLMDGGVSREEIESSVVCDKSERVANRILYTGALEAYNGVMELIEGFLLAKTHGLELVICGGGTLWDSIKERIADHDNIILKGNVPNEEAKKLQRESGLLISTRPTNEYALRLTFPSKIIEYLLSGTPVLTTKLNGLADSYDDYVYYCGENIQEIADGIDDIFSIPYEEREKKAILAKEFVSREKNYEKHIVGFKKVIEEVLG
ncbi:MAG: glycosyltransferase [Clostridia bacterium]|nr:glycosyltransferase [Clostridia bacterium]